MSKCNNSNFDIRYSLFDIHDSNKSMHIKQIIQGCQRNDRKYQKILVEQYSSWLMSISLRYAPDAESAKDALQEAWIRIFKHIRKFDSKKGKLESWMAKIIINTALQGYKNLRYDTEKSGLENLAPQAVIPDIYAQLGTEELMKLIAQLPEGYRIVFNLYVVEGYSHKEIAELLKIQVASSRSQLNRARKQLQVLVQQLENWKEPKKIA